MEKLPIVDKTHEFVHVFDGELVKDRSEDYVKFFIFDALVVNGINVMHLTFENRLKTVKKQIIKKLRIKEYFEINKESPNEFDDEEFKDLDFNINDDSDKIKVFLKDFYLDLHTKDLYEKIVPKLDHGNDGIIYTMSHCPYYPGTCEQIIKWKPAVMNSVDFILKLITSYSDTEYIWGLYTRTYDNPELLFDCIFFGSAEENEKWRKIASKATVSNRPIVVECAFNPELDYDHLLKFNKYKRLDMVTDLPKEEHIKKNFQFSQELSEGLKSQLQGGWIVERQRTDKDFPNSLRVARNIKDTIEDPVTVDDIIACAQKFGEKYGAAGTKRPAQPHPGQTEEHKRPKQ